MSDCFDKSHSSVTALLVCSKTQPMETPRQDIKMVAIKEQSEIEWKRSNHHCDALPTPLVPLLLTRGSVLKFGTKDIDKVWLYF